MRHQPRLVFWLLALMCAVRFSLAAYGYALPESDGTPQNRPGPRSGGEALPRPTRRST